MARIALPRSRTVPTFGIRRPDAWLGAPSALALSWISMALLFATAALSVYLVQISAVANAGYDLQRLDTERKGWLARNEQLELELAKRRSLAWVEAQAVSRLGMVRADKPMYIHVGSSDEPDHDLLAAPPGARPPSRSQSGEIAHASGALARPQPGNPAWALDAVQAWLSLVASH
jgi:cell division protein FtsB